MQLARLSPLLLAAALLATSAPAVAQGGRGPLDDASVLPGGTLRITLAPRWTAASQRFGSPFEGGSASQDFGAFLSGDSLGRAAIPTLGDFEQRIRQVSGATSFRISLGTARVQAQARSTIIPLGIEYGIGRRIAVGIVVPFVRSIVNVVAEGNRTDSTANAGVSPASYNPAEEAKVSLLATEFSSALTQLRSRYASCFGSSPTASGCPAVIQLDSAARSYAALIAATYGATAIVPAAGTAAHDSVLARLGAFNTRFRSALGMPATSNPISARPLGALPIGSADFQAIVTDSAFGIGADSIVPVGRMSIGDVEAGITIGLVDRWGAGSGPRIRASVAGIYRAGTGRPARPGVLLDAATGDGQADVEARGALDMQLGGRVVGSIGARYTVQMADEREMRVPVAGVRLLPASRRATVRRDLGDELGVDVRARYFLSQYLGGLLAYGYEHRGADVITPGSGPGGVARFTSPPRMAQSAAIGLTYSTVDAFLRGKSWMPLELAFMHRQAFAGSGGAPRLFSDAVELRLYVGGGRRALTRPAVRRPIRATPARGRD